MERYETSILSLKFFMTPAEFVEILAEIASELQLNIVLRRVYPTPEILFMEQRITTDIFYEFNPLWVYLTKEKPSKRKVREYNDVSRLGWIEMVVPTFVGNTLVMGNLRGATKWVNKKTKTYQQNPDIAKLYKQVEPNLKRHLSEPVLNLNFQTNQFTPNPNYFYSQGAADFCSRGGVLLDSKNPKMIFLIQ